ncbi:hypothetical protein TI39_contig354g00082 [Zymoseptoria brevis]|uniref:DUF3433 domain protein n=1 Tax=Zymoseptoria brevis TaxID=1047168 RepID=A0A0F4GQ63_9PEZI|nr:hypothetical protein TI39_contig354g00082 [Zymoseptoria brevis]
MSSATHKSDKPLPTIPIVHIEPLEGGDDTNDTAKPAKPWRPVTLRWPYLSVLILITVGLIATIQWLLYVSNRDQGIIFAKDINDLPLRRSFSYMYLPTIISVVYSFLWTWVDLDIKRLEPWFQLSKDGGASGANSVLLSYPSEFLVTLPFTAFKRGHWSVLSAAMIMILVFWGLTPIQAGIFAVRTIRIQETDVLGSLAKDYTPISDQGNLSGLYAQSVYNIAWLNETLPPFMTKTFVLSEVGPTESMSVEASNITYTGPTTLYSVDLSCNPATVWNSSGQYYYNNTLGCSFSAPRYRPMGGNDTTKPFDAIYVGYQNENGFAAYYLSAQCEENNFHQFFVRWSNSTPDAILDADEAGNMDPSMANETSLFCQASYYQQEGKATVSLPSNAVLGFQEVGEKQPLPTDMFNISSFEWAMSSGVEEVPIRGFYPTASFPDQKSQLIDTPLNLAYLPRAAPFAIATSQHPIEAYMDPEILQSAYQSAYRLLFARQLVDILGSKDNGTQVRGERMITTEAVVVVPIFAYAATAVLFLVLILATGIFTQTPRRCNKMDRDPATIGIAMELVAGHQPTSETFTNFDKCNEKDLSEGLAHTMFHLQDSVSSKGPFDTRLRKTDNAIISHQLTPPMTEKTTIERTVTTKQVWGPGIQPMEMKMYIAFAFFLLQAASLIVFLVLFIRARTNNGLPLPSESTFVRQLVQNYIPLALATFIEPFWLLLTRLLSLLQPFEELRKGHAAAPHSIDVDYASVPPQLLFVRAIRARHLVLALVCSMVILANVLSVALSGMMYEGTANVTTVASFSPMVSAHFRALNGTGLPFNGNLNINSDGGTTSEPFYLEMSHLTAKTPVPPWTDEKYAYLPVDVNATNPKSTLQIRTQAFGAHLDCRSLTADYYTITFGEDASELSLNTTWQEENGSIVRCANYRSWTRSFGDSALDGIRDSMPGHVAAEMNAMLSGRLTEPENDLLCRQHILAGWLRADWSIITGAGGGNTVKGLPRMRLDSKNETMMLCKPVISIGPAEIIVDGSGRVRRALSVNASSSGIDQYFTSQSEDLVAQANQFVVDSDSTWHNDSFPSDYLNYLTMQVTEDHLLLDPSRPVPSPDKVAKGLDIVYQRLFALLISTNIDRLFEEADEGQSVKGLVVTPQTRILFSTPAFIVAETILVCYLLTTILFYARRPWRVLPRLPSSIASIVAYFAASGAFQEISRLQKSEFLTDAKTLRESWKWGYGTFMGSDRRYHTGIERDPFVTVFRDENMPTQRLVS